MLFTNLQAIERFNAARRMAWNRPRLLKLCQMLGTTPEAIAIMIGWSPASMRTALKDNRFPGPVCWILETFEQDALTTIGEQPANPCFDPVTPVKLALVVLRKIANGGTAEPPAHLAANVLRHFPGMNSTTDEEPIKP